MPIGPLSHTTICLKPMISSSQSDQRANCGSGPPPPQQQQQQQPPEARIRSNSRNAHWMSASASGQSFAIGRAGPGSPRPSAFSRLAIKSPSLLLCPNGGSVKIKSTPLQRPEQSSRQYVEQVPGNRSGESTRASPQ